MLHTTSGYQNMLSIPDTQAHISVKNNRIKSTLIKDQHVVYLKDGTEFQLELYNNSENYVAAEISFNGVKQSNRLVLGSKQRVYLDRFIDSDKKLKFNTFMTSNDDKLKEIIERNGKIEIKFYEQYINPTYYTNIPWNNIYVNNSITTKSCISNSPSLYRCTLDSCAVLPSNEIESGRIEEGKKSNQKFDSVSMTWQPFPCNTIKLHIMPESSKPIDIKNNVIQVDSIRSYCSTCGRKVKKGWNFCPGCGKQY